MRRQIALWATLLVLCGLIAACGANGGPVAEAMPTLDLVDSAAAEATALIQQARATALVLEAQAQATALVEQAQLAGGTRTSAVPEPVIYSSPTPPPAGGRAESTPSVEPGATPETEAGGAVLEGEEIPVQVTGISFAAEGGMIMVSFLATPEEAEKWWPGSVSVTDEGNGAVYNEIPVMPKIGPLIGRPKVAGQPGYVMLVNPPPYLQPGALVTVVLGTYEFEHVPVQ
jgi:hypothetical protein